MLITLGDFNTYGSVQSNKFITIGLEATFMSSTAIAQPQPAHGMSRAKILVCEANGMIRQAIRIGLNNLGIRDIAEANNLVSAHKSLADGGYDAVVMNTEIEGHDTTFMVREVRLGKLGPDPFLVSILLQSAPDHSKLKQAVDCGTDDLLLIPFAPDQVSTRLDALRARRKPFVVTHDYLGPDRRKSNRPGDNQAVTISPPQPAGVPRRRHPAGTLPPLGQPSPRRPGGRTDQTAGGRTGMGMPHLADRLGRRTMPARDADHRLLPHGNPAGRAGGPRHHPIAPRQPPS